MTKRELVENYRLIALQVKQLDEQIEFLNKYAGGPRPVHAVQLTGMPRGTNEPEAAIMQRQDYNDSIDELEQKNAILNDYLFEFNRILDSLSDYEAVCIIRGYYALGWTDEKIGKELKYDKSTIWRKRRKIMIDLELQPVHITAY